MVPIANPSGARKRPCNPESWKMNKAKKARNSGLEYVSLHTGRMVSAKRVGEPCMCSKQCFDILGAEAISTIHRDYWATGDHALQTAFIQKFTVEITPKRRYTAVEASYRSCSRQYNFKVANNLVPVCKKAFASVLGITPGRIDSALKAQTDSGVLQPDGRGRHQNHSRIAEDRLQLALDYINSFPTVHSHYAKVCFSKYKKLL